jgi:hypothetical protein
MAAAAGLLLALVCLAIVALGVALSITAWQPNRGLDVTFAAGFAVGGGCFVLAALHWLAHLLT